MTRITIAPEDHAKPGGLRKAIDRAQGASLKPCPFCGGQARREDLEDAGNEGGSCIACTKCGAATAVHFDRKENLVSSWNDRI